MIHLDTNYLIGLPVKGSTVALDVDGWLATGGSLAASAIAWTEFLNGPVTPLAVSRAEAVLQSRIIPFGPPAAVAVNHSAQGREDLRHALHFIEHQRPRRRRLLHRHLDFRVVSGRADSSFARSRPLAAAHTPAQPRQPAQYAWRSGLLWSLGTVPHLRGRVVLADLHVTIAFVGMACQDMTGTALPSDFDFFEYQERPYHANPFVS